MSLMISILPEKQIDSKLTFVSVYETSVERSGPWPGLAMTVITLLPSFDEIFILSVGSVTNRLDQGFCHSSFGGAGFKLFPTSLSAKSKPEVGRLSSCGDSDRVRSGNCRMEKEVSRQTEQTDYAVLWPRLDRGGGQPGFESWNVESNPVKEAGESNRRPLTLLTLKWLPIRTGGQRRRRRTELKLVLMLLQLLLLLLLLLCSSLDLLLSSSLVFYAVSWACPSTSVHGRILSKKFPNLLAKIVFFYIILFCLET